MYCRLSADRPAAWAPVAQAKPSSELRRLGRRIRALREAIGLSQEALADEAGIHRTYMSALERGVNNPTYSTMVKLARALRVHPSKLFED